MKLSERIEAADGPSRELDAEIALAKGWARRSDGANWFTPPNSLVAHHKSELPRFTSSIDAAMTLVPEGAHVTITRDGDDWLASVDGHVSRSKSLPLALCAAALRARDL